MQKCVGHGVQRIPREAGLDTNAEGLQNLIDMVRAGSKHFTKLPVMLCVAFVPLR